jgi:hypothetical protein
MTSLKHGLGRTRCVVLVVDKQQYGNSGRAAATPTLPPALKL